MHVYNVSFEIFRFLSLDKTILITHRRNVNNSTKTSTEVRHWVQRHFENNYWRAIARLNIFFDGWQAAANQSVNALWNQDEVENWLLWLIYD